MFPSPHWNADVQRAEGTGGICEVTPVSLPFLALGSPVALIPIIVDSKGKYFLENEWLTLVKETLDQGRAIS